MDVLKMLADLRQERARIEEAIVALERFSADKKRCVEVGGNRNDGYLERFHIAHYEPFGEVYRAMDT
jgi:hypothetical protein